ncbi:hypothetical protein SGRIM128S_02738 [Streptomyces griseomycini]
MAHVSDVRHVLAWPDRETAEEVAEALGERFGVEEEPRLVRDALAGEDDAEDAQWLVVLRDEAEAGGWTPGELDEFAAEWGGLAGGAVAAPEPSGGVVGGAWDACRDGQEDRF